MCSKYPELTIRGTGDEAIWKFKGWANGGVTAKVTRGDIINVFLQGSVANMR